MMTDVPFVDRFFSSHEIDRSLGLFWSRYSTRGSRHGPYESDDEGPSVTEFTASFHRYRKVLFGEIKDGSYKPNPAKRVLAVLDKPRALYRFEVPDRFVLFHLARLSALALESHLDERVHGFRRGRSVDTALISVTHAVRGYGGTRCFVVRRDISNFGESIDHEIARRYFARYIDASPVMIHLLAEFCAFRYLEGAMEHRAEAGLPNGSYLQLVCENLILTEIDMRMPRSGGAYARYGDDMIFVCGHEETARGQSEAFSQGIAELRLSWNVEKSGDFALMKPHLLSSTLQEGFRAVASFPYLGYQVDFRGVVTLPAAKSRLLRSLIRARLERVARFSSNGMNVEDDVRALGRALRRCLSTSDDFEMAQVREMIRRVTEERELRDLDTWVVLTVLKLVFKRGFRKGNLRRLPIAQARRWEVPSLVDLRKRRVV